jgi:Ca2+-binding RTX toxin-like protein
MTPGKTLTGNIVGGGTATLDYSAFTSSVRANLRTGKVVGVSGTVSGVLNITGGQGDDILIGNGLGNTLIGGGGNDVLVANGGNATLVASAGGQSILIAGNYTGTGAATLQGSSNGSDLLIAGSTNWDNNITALNALIAEWGDTSEDAATRIGHIMGTTSGGRNGSTYVLNAVTVTASNGKNTLTAGAGAVDLFFASVGDTITDPSGNGTVILL